MPTSPPRTPHDPRSNHPNRRLGPASARRTAAGCTPPGRAALIVLAVTFLLAGCAPPDEIGRPECPKPIRQATDVDHRACPEWQWVGLIQGQCPEIRGWHAKEILALENPLSVQDEAGRSTASEGDRTAGRTGPSYGYPAPDPTNEPGGDALWRYCRYTYESRGPVPSLERERDRHGFEALGPDCMAVIPLAEAGEPLDAGARALERVFLARSGRAVGLSSGPGPVKLVLVDTVANPDRAQAPPWNAPFNSPHGVGLANMAKRLTCNGDEESGAGCADVTVDAELALAYISYSPFSFAASVRDDVAGGYVGTLSDLATAIDLAATRPGLRVINLSVGWNGHLFGGLEADPAQMEAPVRAVFDAIGDAVAGGALVVAAAGNRHGGPAPEVDVGPMLPAGWAVHLAGDATPLVHAAGGLSHEGIADPKGYRLLPNGRFRAVPRFLAYADHAVVARYSPSESRKKTATLTGSSVASLTLSTAAALSWSYTPAVSGSEVLDHVFEAAEPLTGPQGVLTADFCPGGSLAVKVDGEDVPKPECEKAGEPPTPVRRLRLCEAVRAACTGAPNVNCPTCAPEDLSPPEGVHAAEERFAAAPRFSLEGRKPLRPATSDDCPPAATLAELAAFAKVDAGLRGADAAAPARERFHPGSEPDAVLYRCPQWQSPNVGSMAWVDPQPESSPCTSCDFEPGSPADVYLAIDRRFWSRLSSPVLVVGDRAYALDWDPDAQPVAILEDVEYHDGETVLIAFTLDNGLSAVSPLLRVE